MSISYKDSGVDVERGYKAVSLMKEYVSSTYNDNVLGDLGSFGGFFKAPKGMREPVFVSGTDGVGTKLKYAFLADRHDTIGIDAVAMCVNDIVAQGAKPLFFLDYFATGGLDPQKAADVVKGVAEGCRQCGCALLGGETAEMPGFYQEGEYDIAGFAVGVQDKKKLVIGDKIRPGDVLIGLKSSGLHSNGFSLVRRLLGEEIADLEKYNERLNKRLIDVLLTPTKIYVNTVLSLMDKVTIKGMAHITGGGFIENIPRMFPEGIGCNINIDSYTVPEIFNILRDKSGLSNNELYNTFNMGIGFVICVSRANADKTIALLRDMGEECVLLGKTKEGSGVNLV